MFTVLQGSDTRAAQCWKWMFIHCYKLKYSHNWSNTYLFYFLGFCTLIGSFAIWVLTFHVLKFLKFHLCSVACNLVLALVFIRSSLLFMFEQCLLEKEVILGLVHPLHIWNCLRGVREVDVGFLLLCWPQKILKQLGMSLSLRVQHPVFGIFGLVGQTSSRGIFHFSHSLFIHGSCSDGTESF